MADKKRQENSKFFKGEFSFVNKDAKNIDSKDHNAAVSWHVMNRYERWKKQEQAKKLRASANVPMAPLSSSSSGQQVGRRLAARQTASELTLPQSTVAAPHAPLNFDPWMTDPPLQAGYSRPSPIIPISCNAVPSRISTPSTSSSVLEDPFASMWNTSHTSLELGAENEVLEIPSLPNGPLVNSLIAFAYENIVASSWPAEVGTVQGTWEITHCWDDITAMAQDICFSNAYLALLATAMAEANADHNLLLQGRQFQGKAMAELRQRVGHRNAQDLLTLKAILKLFCTETIVDNTAVARVHLKMLRNLVTSGGGVILLDPWFREDLLSCDCYFALKYGTRPVLPAIEWTPGSLSQPWKARLISAGIFGDHSAMIDPLVEHISLRATFTDLRELLKVYEYIKTNEVPTDDQILRWAQLRKFDCISRLADHLTNLTIYSHLYDKPKTQALTTTAAALMTNMTLGCPEPVRFGLKLLDDLRATFQRSEQEHDPEHSRLRLWAAYVGTLAEKVHPVSASESIVFGNATRSLVRKMKLGDWEEMKEILRQFLFSEKLHHEVETGVPFRKDDFRKGLYSASGTSWREPLTLDMEVPEVDIASPAGKQLAEEG